MKNAETEIYWRYYRNTEKRALFFYLGGISKHIKGTVKDLEKQEIGVSQISKVETGVLRRKKKGKGKGHMRGQSMFENK